MFIVAQYLIKEFKFSVDEFERNMDDLVRRGVLGHSTIENILPVLIENKVINKNFEFSMAPKKIINKVNGKVFELEGAIDPWVPDKVDYLTDYR